MLFNGANEGEYSFQLEEQREFKEADNFPELTLGHCTGNYTPILMNASGGIFVEHKSSEPLFYISSKNILEI